jgi:hypothetical protein
MDNGSGTPITVNSWHQYDLGNADLDTRHRVAVSVNYELPFGNSMTGWGRQLINGWSVNSIYSWASGSPFVVQNPNGVQSGINLGNDRPNMIASPKLSNPTAAEWFNVSAFKLQAAGLLGNERRNQVFGPPQRELDFSLFKEFPIREALRMQFRTEVFNLTNTPNFGQPGATIRGYTSGGIATSAGGFGAISGPSQSAHPREIQFALKLLF